MISFVLSTEFKYNLVKVGVSKGDILSISLAWEGVEGKVYFKSKIYRAVIVCLRWINSNSFIYQRLNWFTGEKLVWYKYSLFMSSSRYASCFCFCHWNWYSSLAAKRFEISQGGVKLSIIWLSINYSSEDVFH